MRNQKGFTLIELVVVIVVLGIIAAIAIPRYVDITHEARLSAVQGVAGGLASASAINYAGALAKGAVYGTTTGAGAPIYNTIDAATPCGDTVFKGIMPDYAIGSYTITSTGALTNVGDTMTCTLTDPGDASVTADFTMYGAK